MSIVVDGAEWRKERIERLLSELHYELARGIMDRELDPFMTWRKIIPAPGVGRRDAVVVEMRSSPLEGWDVGGEDGPKIRLVSSK